MEKEKAAKSRKGNKKRNQYLFINTKNLLRPGKKRCT